MSDPKNRRSGRARIRALAGTALLLLSARTFPTTSALVDRGHCIPHTSLKRSFALLWLPRADRRHCARTDRARDDKRR